MVPTNKTASYLGLARRAGKLTLGVGAVKALRDGVFLLVADEDVSANTRKEIEKLQRKFACPLVYIKGMGALAGAETRMLAAVREEHLASAILGSCGE